MIKIQTLQKEDMPREKLVAKGAKNLSDAELVQLIFGSGVEGVYLLLHRITVRYDNEP